jgi:hypothetical protein
VASNGAVTVIARVSPGTVGGLTPQFAVTKWEWQPDGGAPLQGSQCAPVSTDLPNPKQCTIYPTASGRMTVYAKVNGVAVSLGVHIRVRCHPATGDPKLDSLPLLDAIDSAWRLSRASSANQLLRREALWAVDCVPGGECRIWVGDTSLSTPTQARDTVPLPPSPWVRVATGHTHPFFPCDTTGHPGSCQPGAEILDTALWADTALRRQYREGLTDFVAAPSAFPSLGDLVVTSSDSGRSWIRNVDHYTADSLRILRVIPGLAYDFSRIQRPGIKKNWSGSCRLY